MTPRRAKIVAIVVLIAAFIGGALAARQLLFSGAAVNTASVQQRNEEASIFDLINQRRVTAGLPPFKRDPKLDALARAHSHDMLVQDYFAHDAPGGGPTFAQRFHAISPRRSLGEENIAWGTGYYGTATGLVRLWMTSAPHRANILNPRVHRIGIGISIGSYQGQRGAVIGTQDFSN